MNSSTESRNLTDQITSKSFDQVYCKILAGSRVYPSDSQLAGDSTDIEQVIRSARKARNHGHTRQKKSKYKYYDEQ